MSLFLEHPITYTPVTEIEIEEWRKPDLLVAAFLGPAAIPLLIKAFYGQYLGLVGDEPEHSEESTLRNEPKLEEPASCGGDKEGPAPAPDPAADLSSCPYNSAATADSGSDADADSGSDPDVGDPSATLRPPCPRCSCSCNNNDDKEEDHVDKDEDEDDHDSSNRNTSSANSDPRPTFRSVVFFTLQSFPEALRAVERNLVYNFGPLR
jgi:hypothetical protein